MYDIYGIYGMYGHYGIYGTYGIYAYGMCVVLPEGVGWPCSCL